MFCSRCKRHSRSKFPVMSGKRNLFQPFFHLANCNSACMPAYQATQPPLGQLPKMFQRKSYAGLVHPLHAQTCCSAIIPALVAFNEGRFTDPGRTQTRATVCPTGHTIFQAGPNAFALPVASTISNLQDRRQDWRSEQVTPQVMVPLFGFGQDNDSSTSASPAKAR